MEFEKQFGVIFTNPKLPVLDYSTPDENIEIGSVVVVPLGSKVGIGIVWSAGDNKFDVCGLRISGISSPLFGCRQSNQRHYTGPQEGKD